MGLSVVAAAPLSPATLERLADGLPGPAQHLAELAELHRQLDALVRQGVEAWLTTLPGQAREAAGALFEAGGKRLRPALVMLAAQAAGGRPEAALPVASAVELLHTGTLLHDDVIDQGEQRRGQPTARVVYGNSVAVLAGDYCFFAALEALLAANDAALMARAVEVARELARGELLQLERRGGAPATERECLEIAACKTGALFAFATWGGARAAQAGPVVEARLDQLGRHLGVAFQLADDLLDLGADPQTLGKELGQDLVGGTPTLPLVYALEADPTLAASLAELAAGPTTPERCAEVAARIRTSGAPERVLARLRVELSQATAGLAPLPPSPARTALAELLRRVERRALEAISR